MSAAKSSPKINGTAIATILGLIAAFVSAGAGVYVIWFDKHSDVVVLEQNYTKITPRVCYNAGSGFGLNVGSFVLYYTLESDVKLSNRGAQPATISKASAWDETAEKGGKGHIFAGQLLELGAVPSITATAAAPVLAVGEVHTFRLLGTETRMLAGTEAEAHSILLNEIATMPFNLKWVLQLSDLNKLEIPVQARQDSAVNAAQLVPDKSVSCASMLFPLDR